MGPASPGLRLRRRAACGSNGHRSVEGDLVVDEGDILHVIAEKLPLGNKITTPLETRPGVFAELSDSRLHSVLLIEEGSALHQSRLLASQFRGLGIVRAISGDIVILGEIAGGIHLD